MSVLEIVQSFVFPVDFDRPTTEQIKLANFSWKDPRICQFDFTSAQGEIGKKLVIGHILSPRRGITIAENESQIIFDAVKELGLQMVEFQVFLSMLIANGWQPSNCCITTFKDILLLDGQRFVPCAEEAGIFVKSKKLKLWDLDDRWGHKNGILVRNIHRDIITLEPNKFETAMNPS